MRRQLGWYAFQAVVLLAAFWAARNAVPSDDLGAAPQLVAVFIAWLATGLLARFIDWLRAPRGIVVRDEPNSDRAGGTRIRRSGDGPEHIARPRVGQNIRKLP